MVAVVVEVVAVVVEVVGVASRHPTSGWGGGSERSKTLKETPSGNTNGPAA